jgi:hypothetical protein
MTENLQPEEGESVFDYNLRIHSYSMTSALLEKLTTERRPQTDDQPRALGPLVGQLPRLRDLPQIKIEEQVERELRGYPRAIVEEAPVLRNPLPSHGRGMALDIMTQTAWMTAENVPRDTVLLMTGGWGAPSDQAYDMGLDVTDNSDWASSAWETYSDMLNDTPIYKALRRELGIYPDWTD